MDIRMPVLDGYEATRRIKSEDKDGQTKIIAVSASALKNQQDAILAAGCDGYIAKPFRQTDIFEAMEKHLDVRWVYEDDRDSEDGATADEPDDWRTPVSALPARLRERLEDAVSRADMAATDRFILEIGDYDSRLATTLQKWAHDFEYEAILSLMKAQHEE